MVEIDTQTEFVSLEELERGELMTKWSEKKNPFKVGDRALLEHTKDTEFGTIIGVKGRGVNFKSDKGNTYTEISWRLCKKLVKKPALEFWIARGACIDATRREPLDPENWIHVREVKKK